MLQEEDERPGTGVSDAGRGSLALSGVHHEKPYKESKEADLRYGSAEILISRAGEIVLVPFAGSRIRYELAHSETLLTPNFEEVLLEEWRSVRRKTFSIRRAKAAKAPYRDPKLITVRTAISREAAILELYTDCPF